MVRRGLKWVAIWAAAGFVAGIGFVAAVGVMTGFSLWGIQTALGVWPEATTPGSGSGLKSYAEWKAEQTPGPGEADPSQPTPEPAAVTWVEVASWTGSSMKETETFTVASREWRVVWEAQGAGMNFQISVHSRGGDPKSYAANIIGEGQDVSYVRGAGDYYLSIVSTGQRYVVSVQQAQ